MATVDQRVDRLQRRLDAATPPPVDNIDMSDDHVVAVWRALRIIGAAEQFLPDGMTLEDLDAFIAYDYRSGIDS